MRKRIAKRMKRRNENSQIERNDMFISNHRVLCHVAM